MQKKNYYLKKRSILSFKKAIFKNENNLKATKIIAFTYY